MGHQHQPKHHIQLHRVNKPAIRSREYQNLRHVVPSLRRQRDVDKVEVVTEAARYIDHLHKTLIERFVVCGIPDSLKDILGTDNANELGSHHIMNLVANMARTQRQQQQQQMEQPQRQQQQQQQPSVEKSRQRRHSDQQLAVIAPINARCAQKTCLTQRTNFERTTLALPRRRRRSQLTLVQRPRACSAKLLSPSATTTIPTNTRAHHYYHSSRGNIGLAKDRNCPLPPPSRRRDSTDG